LSIAPPLSECPLDVRYLPLGPFRIALPSDRMMLFSCVHRGKPGEEESVFPFRPDFARTGTDNRPKCAAVDFSCRVSLSLPVCQWPCAPTRFAGSGICTPSRLQFGADPGRQSRAKTVFLSRSPLIVRVFCGHERVSLRLPPAFPRIDKTN